MQWGQNIEYAALSDIGFRRQNNQDSFSIRIAPDRESFEKRGHLFLVADGMGGHAVGELASKMAADSIPHTFHKLQNLELDEALETAICDANTAINERGRQNHDFLRMGTTCTTLILSPAGAYGGHVGDSRLYRIRSGTIDQLTFDHSLQWELLKLGKKSAEEVLLHEPRNVITRCLGPEPQVEVDIEGAHEILPGDIYLLCSDGLTGLVNDSEIGTIAKELSPTEACQLLVNLANLRGGPDNITVVIARVGQLPGGIPDASPGTPQEASKELGWGWVTAVTVLGITFTSAFVLCLLGQLYVWLRIPGLLALGVTALEATIMGLAWRRRYLANHWGRQSPPTTQSPYRSAPANISSLLVSQLVSLQHDLHQAAVEENWAVDWEAHKTCYAEAKSSLNQEQFPRALRAFGKVIHNLMLGLQLERKRMTHIAKWGTRAGDPRSPARASKT